MLLDEYGNCYENCCKGPLHIPNTVYTIIIIIIIITNTIFIVLSYTARYGAIHMREFTVVHQAKVGQRQVAANS